MVAINDFTKVYEQGGVDIRYVSGANPLKRLTHFSGSDNTASGTFTTILDEGGSGVLLSITTEISNSGADPAYRITINGNEPVEIGDSRANPFKPSNSGLNQTEHFGLPYNNGIKVEVDSSSASYTAWSTVLLLQD